MSLKVYHALVDAVFAFCVTSETPIWPISEAALSYGPASNRLQQLAKAKPLCPFYEFQRTCYNSVSGAAKKATASQRTMQLAQPNKHKVWPGTDRYLDLGFTRPVTEVSAAAMTANCGPRTTQLAEPRELDEDCLPERPLPIPVAESALLATASDRLKTLGQPVRAKDKWGSEDENAPYRVSEAAQHCVPSARTVELALPLRVKGVKVQSA